MAQTALFEEFFSLQEQEIKSSIAQSKLEAKDFFFGVGEMQVKHLEGMEEFIIPYQEIDEESFWWSNY